MASRPRAKQLSIRGRVRPEAFRRATWVAGSASKLLMGTVASASPPTLTAQKVATAIAHQRRSARRGSSIFVWCHCHPPRLPIFEASFDGLVTNDKFCLSRSAHLQLSHWRLALSQRLSGAAPSVYPLTQLVGSGGIDEAAPVDRSSPVPGNPRRPTSVGPRLSAVTAVGSRINRSSE